MLLSNSETVIEAGFTYFEYLRHLFIILVYNEKPIIYNSWAIQIKFDYEYRFFVFFCHEGPAHKKRELVPKIAWNYNKRFFFKANNWHLFKYWGYFYKFVSFRYHVFFILVCFCNFVLLLPKNLYFVSQLYWFILIAWFIFNFDQCQNRRYPIQPNPQNPNNPQLQHPNNIYPYIPPI